MSVLQIAILGFLWAVALIPFVFVSILPSKFRAAVGFSTFAIAPGIGGCMAAAGVWLGILRMQAYLSNASLIELITRYWDHVVFIVVGGTAVSMIGAAGVILYYSSGIDFSSSDDQT